MRTEKYCPDCNTVKELHRFSKSKSHKDGRQGKCKSCYRVYQMSHKYGISVQRYKALVSHHQGRCGICDKEKPLVIDHNHETGKIRGLLCSECNTGIGLLQDSIEVIRAAEGYLLHD